MKYTDFFYKKLYEVFCGLSTKELELMLLSHPSVASVTIVTHNDMEAMRLSGLFDKGKKIKLPNLESDHAAEL